MKKVAIITDLGNVLFRFRERTEVISHALRAFQGGVYDPQLQKKFLHKIFPHLQKPRRNDDLYHHLDVGEIDLQDVFKVLCGVSKINPTSENYARFFALFCQHLEPILPVVEFYLQLQKKYPLVAVSNGDAGSRHAIDLLQGYHGMRFAHVFVSCECKMRKPQLLKVVRDDLAKRGFDPAKCPFIDDIADYVAAAKECGLYGIRFDGTKQDVRVLRARLKKIGIPR